MNELSGVAAAAVLFGFLFAGFWWSLNRELTFKVSDRHFKPGYVLLFASVAFVGYFGLVAPLREAAQVHGSLKSTYYGVTLGVIAVIGYMLTEFAHYSIFQRPKYTTVLEWIFFVVTAILIAYVGFRFFSG
jgi:hypothetical protein